MLHLLDQEIEFAFVRDFLFIRFFFVGVLGIELLTLPLALNSHPLFIPFETGVPFRSPGWPRTPVILLPQPP